MDPSPTLVRYDDALALSLRQLQALQIAKAAEPAIDAARLAHETTRPTVESLLRRGLLECALIPELPELNSPRIRVTERGDAALAQAPLRGQRPRGFAAMSPKKQQEIASLGGKASHARGTAHEFTPETARAAGRLAHQHRQDHRKNRKEEEGKST